jgi:hypothetical protein
VLPVEFLSSLANACRITSTLDFDIGGYKLGKKLSFTAKAN